MAMDHHRFDDFPEVPDPNREAGLYWGSYDWIECWEAPGGVEWYAATAPPKATVDPIEPEDIEEVTHIYALSYQDYADQSMCAIMKLKDGRWALVDTWSDSSGYGCRDGTTWLIGNTLDDIITHGLTDMNAKELGIER